MRDFSAIKAPDEMVDVLKGARVIDAKVLVPGTSPVKAPELQLVIETIAGERVLFKTWPLVQMQAGVQEAAVQVHAAVLLHFQLGPAPS